MTIYPETLPVQARYKVLIGSIVPRFIAWVTTRSPAGASNLAPFSYATIAGHAPMSLLFVVAGRKPDGRPKDTLRNAQPASEGGTGEFVVHVVDENHAESMARSAAPFDYETSELEALSLRQTPSSRVSVPRLLDAKVAFECRTTHVIPVGISTVVVGEVVAIHAAPGLIDDRFHVDQDKLGAIGRMAGSAYVRTRDRFQIEDAGFFPTRDTKERP